MKTAASTGPAGLALALAFAFACAIGCAGVSDDAEAPTEPPAYTPDRRDYISFQTAYPDLLEPNYLPFMVHRLPRPQGDVLVFCRWPADRMPIDVFIQTPRIPDSLQDEFHEIEPAIYVEGAERALRLWEDSLEGLVRFRRVDTPAAAELTIRLIGARGPAEIVDAPGYSQEILALGSTPLADACLLEESDPNEDDLPRVHYDAHELEIYVADHYGLLTATQVERVTLHELGHVLGMRGHSPVPVDLMFPVAQDRPDTIGLSTSDVHSFLSLYRLPNGAEFGRVWADGERPPPPPPLPPSGSPMLGEAPFVSEAHGFRIRVPTGWLRVTTDHGLFASNGPIWDHDVSIEVFLTPYPTIDAYLRAYGPSLFADTWLRRRSHLAIGGRPGLEIVAEDAAGRIVLGFVFLEVGDGRLALIHTRSPSEVSEAWQPWFLQSLASLELTSAAP